MKKKCFLCESTENLKRIEAGIEFFLCDDCRDLLKKIREVRKNTIVFGGGSIEIDLSD